MEKIILDTNFLLAVYELRLDIFEEIFRVIPSKYEIYVLSGTIKELEKLINSPLLSKKQAAKIALELIKIKNINILKISESQLVDDTLVDLNGYIIATIDTELKRRLKQKGTRVLTIRQKKYLVLE